MLRYADAGLSIFDMGERFDTLVSCHLFSRLCHGIAAVISQSNIGQPVDGATWRLLCPLQMVNPSIPILKFSISSLLIALFFMQIIFGNYREIFD